MWLAVLSVSSPPSLGSDGLHGKLSVGIGNVFRGLQHGDSGISPSIYLENSWVNGLYVGIWWGRFDASYKADIDSESHYYGYYPYKQSVSDDRDSEVNYIAGYGHRFSNTLAVETSFTHYQYPNASGYRDYDWNEWMTRLQLKDQWSLGYGLGRSWFADNQLSHLFEITHVRALPGLLELDINVGLIFLEGTTIDDYQYVELGVGRSFGQWNLRAEVSTTDNEIRRQLGSSLAGTQGSLTLSFMF